MAGPYSMMIILFATSAAALCCLILGVLIIATLAERQETAKGKASQLMIPLDFEVLTQAIKEGAPVWFKYTDRFGVFTQRRAVVPRGFFETPKTASWQGKTYLWSSHIIHGRREQYNVTRIFDVRFFPRLLEAVIDPSLSNIFWAGGGVSLETTIL